MKLGAKQRLLAWDVKVSKEDKPLEQKVRAEVRKLRVKYKVKNPKYLGGWCAVFCVDLMQNHLVSPEYKPFSVMWGEEEHVVLLDPNSKRIIDPAGDQFDNPLISYKGNPGLGYKAWKRLSKADLESVRQEALTKFKD